MGQLFSIHPHHQSTRRSTSIKKKVLKNDETKWEVRVWTNGRGSKRLARWFDKKVAYPLIWGTT
jgi:hypothetical protein